LKFISLLTDFGLQDGYAGVLKGVIWQIAPDAQVADITHNIAPQNILEGALLLGRAAPYFPPGTVHVAVVDPGVGTHRRPIAARLGEQYYVCPDNGLLTVLIERAAQLGETMQFVHLDRPQYWLPKVSNVFHGRDIFAPVAAHLANGVTLQEVGSPIQNAVRLRLPRPKAFSGGWKGEVIQIDVFGNLCTNLEESLIASLGDVQIQIAGQTIPHLARTFGDGHPGDLVAMIDSSDRLSICVVNGSAARHLGASVGTPVTLLTSPSEND